MPSQQLRLIPRSRHVFSDYALNDFPGFEHHEWPLKRVIAAESNAAMGDRVKVIALMVGVFLGTYNSPYCASRRSLCPRFLSIAR